MRIISISILILSLILVGCAAERMPLDSVEIKQPVDIYQVKSDNSDGFFIY